MKTPTPRLESTTTEAMEENKAWAAAHIRASTQPRVDAAGAKVPPLWSLTPWKERTIADVASLKLGEMHEAERRADKLSNRPIAMLGVVMMPARAQSIEEWDRESKAPALDAIDVAALPVKRGP